jgi:hypothetical protein
MKAGLDAAEKIISSPRREWNHEWWFVKTPSPISVPIKK